MRFTLLCTPEVQLPALRSVTAPVTGRRWMHSRAAEKNQKAKILQERLAGVTKSCSGSQGKEFKGLSAAIRFHLNSGPTRYARNVCSLKVCTHSYVKKKKKKRTIIITRCRSNEIRLQKQPQNCRPSASLQHWSPDLAMGSSSLRPLVGCHNKGRWMGMCLWGLWGKMKVPVRNADNLISAPVQVIHCHGAGRGPEELWGQMLGRTSQHSHRELLSLLLAEFSPQRLNRFYLQPSRHQPLAAFLWNTFAEVDGKEGKKKKKRPFEVSIYLMDTSDNENKGLFYWQHVHISWNIVSNRVDLF